MINSNSNDKNVLKNFKIIMKQMKIEIAKEQMSLKNYQKKIETNLLKASESKTLTQQIMNDYEQDFLQFYNDNWNVEELIPVLLNYLI